LSSQVVVRPQARTDVTELGNYLAQRSRRVAARFLAAVANTLAELAESPDIGHPITLENLTNLEIRAWPIKKFPKYIVFYRTAGGNIDVVRILHGARDLEAAFDV